MRLGWSWCSHSLELLSDPVIFKTLWSNLGTDKLFSIEILVPWTVMKYHVSVDISREIFSQGISPDFKYNYTWHHQHVSFHPSQLRNLPSIIKVNASSHNNPYIHIAIRYSQCVSMSRIVVMCKTLKTVMQTWQLARSFYLLTSLAYSKWRIIT